MFRSVGQPAWFQNEGLPDNEAMRQGLHDGMLAGHIAARIGETFVSSEELELRAGIAWGLKRMIPVASVPQSGSAQDYIRCFCAAYQASSEDHQKRMENLRLPDIGHTLEAIRAYFEAPDLELPPDVEGVCLHAVMHSPSREPFHLLSAAVGSFAGDAHDPRHTLRDIPRSRGRFLACKALLPDSAVLPATGRAEWANEQIWLGEHTRSFAITR